MKLQKILFALLIFTIPSNLFKTFFETTAYVNGLQVDYLIPKLHLTDLIILALLISLLTIKKNRTMLLETITKLLQKPLLFIAILLLAILQFTVPHWIIATLFFVRIIGLLGLGILLKNNIQILHSKLTEGAITLTLLFQSLLAWYQYLYQKSFFGYYFLGETNLNSYAGIAQSTSFGIQKILPYGTTAHPNVLAGVLTILSLVQLNKTLGDTKYRRVNTLILFIAVTTILLTQSLSAILAFTVGALTLFLSKKYINLFTLKKIGSFFIISNILVIYFLSQTLYEPIPTSTSIFRRAFLNDAAINMTTHNMLTGVGLQNFTASVETYGIKYREIVRFVQPAHNVLLLFIAETGILGITILLTVITPSLRKKRHFQHPEYIVALIPILVLDHYLLTIQSGILLFSFSILLSQTQTT